MMQSHQIYRRLNRRRWGVFLLAACLSTGLLAACSEQEDTAKRPSSAAEHTADAGPQEQADASAANPYDRRVFGLPLPPHTNGLVDRGDTVRVRAAISLKEVGAFFEKNFVDFEVLYGHDEVYAVGLRDYMPRVHAYPYGRSSFVIYTRGKTKPQKADKDAEKTANKTVLSANTPPPKPLHEYKKGDPVLERTASGELLAPGARWGEAYTPPPGSPLDSEYYRPNFGRPYGQWLSR